MKTGLNYYQADTDRFQDIKVKRLKKTFGCQGYAVYEYILCEAYRVKGYYLEWNSDVAFDIAEYWGVKESLVNEIVKYCGAVGLFDKGLLSDGIVSSRAIQRRYLDMCGRARRKGVGIIDKIRITEELPKITEEMPKITEELPKMRDNSGRIAKNYGRIEQNNSNSNNISLSISPSFEEDESDNIKKERETFFEIFFYKNFADPDKEVERFMAHYGAVGWCRANGQPIKDKTAVAQLWEQENKNAPPRFPEGFLPALREAHKELRAAGCDTSVLLRNIHGVTISPESVRIFCTREVVEMIEHHGLSAFKATPLMRDRLLMYSVKRET